MLSLDVVARSPSSRVLIEKFGRTPIEALVLVERARKEGFALQVIHLGFPRGENPVAASIRRQLARGLHHGRPVTRAEARQRALNHVAHASGRWTLRELRVPVCEVDCTRPLDENHARIREALGLKLARLPWDEAPLRELAQVAEALRIEAWACAGHLYRPFWNGRFGPVQLPGDVDVAVHAQDDVAPLLDALGRAFPARRWSVMCPSARLWRQHGIATASLHEAKSHAKLAHKAGAVRWGDDCVEVRLSEDAGAERVLWSGEVALNERLVAAAPSDPRARDAAGVERALLSYPGLRVHPDTAVLLGGFAAAWRPRAAPFCWKGLKQEVLAQVAERGPPTRARRRFTSVESALAEQVLAFHRGSAARAEAPSRVDRADWPEPLEALRRACERKKAGLALDAAEHALFTETRLLVGAPRSDPR